MTPESILPVIAQIAATFAGFTALVSIVDQGQGGRWARISIWRIMMMLRMSLTLIMMCLLPALLFAFELEAPAVWVTAVSLNIVVSTALIWKSIRDTRSINADQGAPLNNNVRRVNMTLGACILIVQVLALSGLVSFNLAGVYLLTQCLNLLMTSLVFFALIQQLDLQRLERQSESLDKPNTDQSSQSNG